MSASDSPSRRQVLTGRAIPPPPQAHISSLVVHARPENTDAARASLLAMPGVDIHAEASGKMIVTLETANETDIVERLHEISLLDGVMSAALVFHHIEPAGENDPAAKQG